MKVDLLDERKLLRIVRKLFQIFFLSAALYLTIKLLAGVRTRTVEFYCPMGGILSVYGIFRRQQFICALGEMNLSIALALLGAVLLTKRSFCSWVCPLGTISEYLVRLRMRVLRGRSFVPQRTAGIVLSKFKYIVLAVIIVLSYKLGEIVFRGYDPFYIIFTGAKGHGVIPGVSILVVTIVLVVAFFVDFAWCRYICPLAAVITPLSRIGLVKVRRDASTCLGCGRCDKVCPQRLPVMSMAKVVSGDCTNCMECIASCPESGALDMGF